jgi:hypothetical protein
LTYVALDKSDDRPKYPLILETEEENGGTVKPRPAKKPHTPERE